MLTNWCGILACLISQSKVPLGLGDSWTKTSRGAQGPSDQPTLLTTRTGSQRSNLLWWIDHQV
ncbi:uncharacterized protein BDZ83DRAFT_642049 [Colletotrichum acutatum]|uniref:Uncharacterized protein n=1 Tax=Glomerella acutata TaxID=27357 RepID=A0AAD8XBY5_GLOAC|nr:uncharacterized protein BDZ83DRAFT_642049 [Colletotrichum acutatum]KAK1708663.1 hypothetical protein BDZ83DRAFT_642049 [Colletotrichum acutatum]